MNKIKRTFLTGAISLLVLSPMSAEEMDHSKHKGMDHGQHNMTGKKSYKQKKTAARKLEKLDIMTKSGIAREAGFDGKYAMETTTARDSLKMRCAKASRGLIMLDNKSWKKCGGKPKGWAKGPGKQKTQSMDHSQHSNH